MIFITGVRGMDDQNEAILCFRSGRPPTMLGGTCDLRPQLLVPRPGRGIRAANPP